MQGISSWAKSSWLRNAMPYLLFIGIILAVFPGFFMHGHTLDGNNDLREQIMPFTVFSLRAFQELVIPQWNPYIFCGMNFSATPDNPFFYPLKWIAYVLPEKQLPVSLTVLLIVHVFLAAVFSFKLFEKLFGDRYWALCAAVIYILSASSTVNMTTELSFESFAWLPLWLYLILTFTERSLLANFVFQSAVITLLFLGGVAQINLYVACFCCLYALYNAINETKAGVKILLISTAAIMTALMMAAVRLLPLYSGTLEVSETMTVSYSSFVENSITSGADLFRLFTPGIHGKHLHENFFGSRNALESFSVYVGVIGAFFGLYAFFFVFDKRTNFWKAALLLLLLVILGTPLAMLHYYAGGREPAIYSRLAWLMPICLAALFGFTGLAISKERSHINRFMVFSLFLCIAVLAAMLWQGIISPENEPMIKGPLAHFGIFCFAMAILFILLKIFDADSRPAQTFLFAALVVDLLLIARIDLNIDNEFLSPKPPFFKHSAADKAIAAKFAKEGRNFRTAYLNTPPVSGLKGYLEKHTWKAGGIHGNTSVILASSAQNSSSLVYEPENIDDLKGKTVWFSVLAKSKGTRGWQPVKKDGKVIMVTYSYIYVEDGNGFVLGARYYPAFSDRWERLWIALEVSETTEKLAFVYKVQPNAKTNVLLDHFAIEVLADKKATPFAALKNGSFEAWGMSPQGKPIPEQFSFRQEKTDTVWSTSKNIIPRVYASSGYGHIVPPLIADMQAFPDLSAKRARMFIPHSARLRQLTGTAVLVYDDRSGIIQSFLPRVKLFNQYEVIPDKRASLQRLLQDPDFDFRNTIVLAEAPSIAIKADKQPGGKAAIIEESNEKVKIELSADSNSLLLFNDTYNKYWQAHLDGAPVALKRGNYAFRVVEVPKGKHELVLAYKNKAAALGLRISVFALAVFLALSALSALPKPGRSPR